MHRNNHTRPISVLAVFLFLAGTASAQIRFPDGSVQSTAFGGTNNVASGVDATVGGGVDNIASGDFSTVAGGTTNLAGGEASVVGGGTMNESVQIIATIAGGELNFSSGDGSTIAGGFFNDATNLDATVGGGSENIASGLGATVPGGSQNIAAGDLSFATGFGATVEAAHPGATIFADSSLFFFFSDRANEFAARATGGVRFVTSISGSTGEPLNGVKLNPGSGSWLSLSDRNAKENIRPVDAEGALDEVLALPINTWNYKTQAPEIRHMGPMAQDFHDAFGLGTDDRHIASVDADGAALAAIQGLHRRMLRENEELSGDLARKERAIASLRNENAALSARLDALETLILEAAQAPKAHPEN